MNISYMVVTPVENKLKKGQKEGDATKVIVSAEIGTLDGQVPTVETEVKSHEVNSEGYRIVGGEKIKANNINTNRRGMQLAIINSQKSSKNKENINNKANFDIEL